MWNAPLFSGMQMSTFCKGPYASSSWRNSTRSRPRANVGGWGGTKPDTHIQGMEPIDVCMHTRDIKTVLSCQKSFHHSVRDHRTLTKHSAG